MASSSSFLNLVLLLIFLASSASARPCKTLLISTYSVSFQPRNPNLQSRPELIAVVTEFRPEFFPENPQFGPRHPRGLIRVGQDQTLIRSTSSFRDCTVDILNIIASLLFGAACGALTAGTMYFVWSLFTSRFDNYQSLDDFSDDEDEDDEDEIFYPKKLHSNKDEGCVIVVPAAPSLADSTETALLRKESA